MGFVDAFLDDDENTSIVVGPCVTYRILVSRNNHQRHKTRPLHWTHSNLNNYISSHGYSWIFWNYLFHCFSHDCFLDGCYFPDVYHPWFFFDFQVSFFCRLSLFSASNFSVSHKNSVQLHCFVVSECIWTGKYFQCIFELFEVRGGEARKTNYHLFESNCIVFLVWFHAILIRFELGLEDGQMNFLLL